MAGDATIQAAIQDLLQALTSTFASADVSLGDMRILGRSASSPYAIIYPGELRSQRSGDWGQVQFIWTHTVEIWYKWRGDDYSTVSTTRQSVVDKLAASPTLGGTTGICDSLVTESSGPVYLWEKGQGRDQLPAFVGFRLTVRTVEERTFDGSGEFA